ncbi:MAG: hypothetical protein HY951_14415 [Bacteroidia bacterium]|nr:hypothetical protein [Bacteroidia bacterium]
MATETQYTANTGAVVISRGNPNRDGTTGDYYNVVTGASNGTLIKRVFIKSQGNTTDGMIRLFAYDGTNTKMLAEVFVPTITRSATDPSFETVIELNYVLKSGGILKASTQNAETFNIIAESLNWAYYGSVRPESTRYTANTGMKTPNSGISTMTGSGTTLDTNIWNIISAASNGTIIQSITVKAQITTTVGMIRLFLFNPTGSLYFLLTEIPVPLVTKSSTAHSFSHRLNFGGNDFALQAEWSIRATTENSEAFNVIAEGLDWAYPA